MIDFVPTFFRKLRVFAKIFANLIQKHQQVINDNQLAWRIESKRDRDLEVEPPLGDGGRRCRD